MFQDYRNMSVENKGMNIQFKKLHKVITLETIIEGYHHYV
jgi:hypothetical protein